MKKFNADAVIAKLIVWGKITRVRRGWYSVADHGSSLVSAANVIKLFAQEVEPGRFVFRDAQLQYRAEHRGNRPLRTLNILSYNSSNHGHQTEEIEAALARIELDEDGVRRSYGVEYEIYRMTAQQQSELAYLLDTLPHCSCHSDGSLDMYHGGVELVFDPVGEADYIRIVKTLRKFVDDNHLQMSNGNVDSGAGMHTTYGVNNSEIIDKSDLQIRLNRCIVMLRASMTQSAIRRVFGRYFTGYASLPDLQSMSTMNHSNAASTNGRPRCCWEFRLPNWKADPEKVVAFFKATEWCFHRVPTGDDMAKLVKLLADWNE